MILHSRSFVLKYLSYNEVSATTLASLGEVQKGSRYTFFTIRKNSKLISKPLLELFYNCICSPN